MKIKKTSYDYSYSNLIGDHSEEFWFKSPYSEVYNIELLNDDEDVILVDDEENIGCQINVRPENDTVDLLGEEISDDF